MSGPRIGSLFSGYGGLDMGVQSVIGGTVAWHVEFDEAPSKILAHHWPDVPNYGDITRVDWTQVEPVDVLTGGFPCQDVSLAGARKGLMDGTRSGLWSEFAKAIDILRPQLVVIENVRGLLSAKTIEEVTDAPDSDSEYGETGVGEPAGGNRPVLNAFGRVLLDLAELGYDTEWCGVRASDAGAPHGRFRVFIIARPHVRHTGHDAGHAQHGIEPEIAGSGAWQPGAIAPIDYRSEQEKRGPAITARELAAHPTHNGHEWARDSRDRRAGSPNRDQPATDTESGGRGVRNRINERATSGEVHSPVHDSDAPSGAPGTSTRWGNYEPAIRRWEAVTGRTAPAPTSPDGKNGSHRLSSRFVEFMMGIPEGHVTNTTIGLTRNQQLKALGNGVVPQQAALAVRYLLNLNIETERAA